MPKFFLKLYISGNSVRSRRAVSNLQTFCDREFPEQSQIEVIDVVKHPEIAEAEKILITPTLIREFPQPQERIIGDLSDREILSFILNLNSELKQKN